MVLVSDQNLFIQVSDLSTQISDRHYNLPMDRYRITEGIGVYFITFTITAWLPIFVDEKPISILIDSFKYCIENKDLRITAYVIMPTHFHAVLFDAKFDPENLKETLTGFRKFTGLRLCDYVDSHFSRPISAVLHSDKWPDRDRQFWQPGWHAEGIFNDPFLQQKVDYIHLNPCRKGLVRSPQDWRFSSAAYWYDDQPVDIPVTGIFWE